MAIVAKHIICADPKRGKGCPKSDIGGTGGLYFYLGSNEAERKTHDGGWIRTSPFKKREGMEELNILRHAEDKNVTCFETKSGSVYLVMDLFTLCALTGKDAYYEDLKKHYYKCLETDPDFEDYRNIKK